MKWNFPQHLKSGLSPTMLFPLVSFTTMFSSSKSDTTNLEKLSFIILINRKTVLHSSKWPLSFFAFFILFDSPFCHARCFHASLVVCWQCSRLSLYMNETSNPLGCHDNTNTSGTSSSVFLVDPVNPPPWELTIWPLARVLYTCSMTSLPSDPLPMFIWAEAKNIARSSFLSGVYIPLI